MRLLHHKALAALFATFGRVVYRSKLPSPSVLTPCDYRMLQSQAKQQAQLVIWETMQRSPYALLLYRDMRTERLLSVRYVATFSP